MKRVVEAIKRIIGTVAGPMPLHNVPRRPVPDSMPLRLWAMPKDATHAASTHRAWSALNGRYYLQADVVLEDSTFIRDMTFDGDSRIAVEVGGQGLSEFPDCFGKGIVEFFTVVDCAAGTLRFKADEGLRSGFARRHRADGGAAGPSIPLT